MRILFIMLISISSVITFAQTPDEVKEIQKHTKVSQLTELAKHYSREASGNYKKALQFAKIKGWELKKRNKAGLNLKLIGITKDLKPVYSQPLSLNNINMSNVLSGNLNSLAAFPFDVKASVTGRVNKLYLDGGLGLALHGESMTVGVWDVATVQADHEAFIDKSTNLTRVLQADTSTTDPDTEGYHTNSSVGMVVAADTFQVTTTEGSKTVTHIRGMAFKGNAHVYDAFDAAAEAAIAASQGLLISNHSYVGGNGLFSTYDATAARWDSIMHLAPYYLSIWACGNEVGIVDLLNNTATAKNGLAVAATKEVPIYTGPSSVLPMDWVDYYGVRHQTSRGPSDDGRIKPDIATQGEGTSSVFIAHSYGYPTFKSSGTSNSSPSVAGTLILLQQHYVNLKGHFLRAATLKGVALHTADECGDYPGPDITFGWGLLNAEKAANAITNNGGTSLISEDSLASGQIFTKELIASGSEPLIATICWTDIPGLSISSDNNYTKNLINDLDIRITSDGTTSYPWKLDVSNGKTSVRAAALKGDNDRDNVEKIEIPNPIDGQIYTLTVSHKGSLVTNGQRFSLIVTGLKQCVATRNISATVNSASSDLQQASSTILATNVINAGADATYHANDEVIMSDGFTALNGSVYHAYLEGCTADFAARLNNVTRPVVLYDVPRKIESEPLVEMDDRSVYPNPGNGVVTIKLNESSKGSVEVFDLSGRLIIKNKFVNQNKLNLNISSEASGIYIIKIITDKTILTKTFVKI